MNSIVRRYSGSTEHKYGQQVLLNTSDFIMYYIDSYIYIYIYIYIESFSWSTAWSIPAVDVCNSSYFHNLENNQYSIVLEKDLHLFTSGH